MSRLLVAFNVSHGAQENIRQDMTYLGGYVRTCLVSGCLREHPPQEWCTILFRLFNMSAAGYGFAVLQVFDCPSEAANGSLLCFFTQSPVVPWRLQNIVGAVCQAIHV